MLIPLARLLTLLLLVQPSATHHFDLHRTATTATATTARAVKDVIGTAAAKPPDQKQQVSIVSLPPVSFAPETKDFSDGVLAWGQWIFNLGLVIVGGFQVWLLRITWVSIRTQATEMQRQNKNILRQTQAAIRAEQPWIVVKIDRFTGNIRFAGVNEGRTPAAVTGIFCTIKPLDPRSFAFPEDLESMRLPNDGLTVPGSSFVVRDCPLLWAADELRGQPGMILVALIRIEYWDMFTDRTSNGAKPHVSQVCYAIDPEKQGAYRMATEFTRHS